MRLPMLAVAGAIALVTVSEADAFYRPMMYPMAYRSPYPMAYGASWYNLSANSSAGLYRQYYQAYLMARAAEIKAQRANGGQFVGPFIGPPNPLSSGNPPVYLPPPPYGKSMYAVPRRFQYLPLGAVIRGPRLPGTVFDLQVATFQGRKVFIPVTGGGDGGGD